MVVTLAIEDPDQPDILDLLREGDAYYASLYPAESNHLLDIGDLKSPQVAFHVARREDGMLLGFGAIVLHEGYAEIKRMYVAPAARGLKLGRTILERLEDHARSCGRDCLRLETGIRQPEAIGLYRSAGYVGRGPFGDYAADPHSLFLEKRLVDVPRD